MTDQPLAPDSDSTVKPDPEQGPDPIDPDIPTDPGTAGDDDGERDRDTPAGAADSASLGSPDESPTT